MTQRVFDNRADFINQSAAEILRLIRLALARHGSCTIILAGGNTPRPVYEKLGAALSVGRVRPESLYFFLGDERHVPANDPERNATMVEESLFRFFPPSRANVFFWDTPPLSPAECAARYDKTLAEFFMRRQRNPDITLLGLGADGHTASLFPGGEIVDERDLHHSLSPDAPGNALAVWVPTKKIWRLSMSARFLRTSKELVFLVGGPGKEEAVRKLVSGDITIPAGWVIDGRRESPARIMLHT
jgi:6-phosphogluconolactonase